MRFVSKSFVLIASCLVSLLLISIHTDASATSSDIEKNPNLESILSCSQIEELKTEFANAYQTSEETITYVVDSQKINFRDSDGKWQEVNNNIVETDKNDNGFLYRNSANDSIFSFGLKEDGTVNNKVEKDQYLIEISLVGNKTTSLNKENRVESFGVEYLEDMNQRNNTIIYKNVFTDTDMAYTIHGDTLKEEFIVYEKPSYSEITYKMQLKGLIFNKITEKVTGMNEETGEETSYTVDVGVFLDPISGAEVFRLSDFYIIDSNNNCSSSLKWDFSVINDEYYLTFFLDMDFVINETTKYPIIIDPTIQGSSVTYDTYASSLYPNSNYYLNSYVRTGKDTTYGQRRIAIKWSIPALSSLYPIMSSNINLYKGTSSGAINLNAERLITSWSSSTVTWNAFPTSEMSYGVYYSTSSGNWHTIGITKLTERWVTGQYSNNGVKIYDDNTTSTSIWASFYSSDYGTVSNTPKLVITVNTDSTYWGQGDHYISNNITINNGLVQYSSQVSPAVSAWNTSGAECNLSVSSTSSLIVGVDNTLERDGVISRPPNSGSYSSFSITLNESLIATRAECSNYATGVIVHELGHALGLLDMEGQQYCVMGYGRDKNIIYRPTTSDVSGVNYIW